ncbi:ABC transporter permease [Limnochorda pilosa]|uniref:Glutathione ABC transporter permease GsiD n=1 Tax=Limnochorda pilosa TaxID=1555112 RepID=A0A0K2SMG5_LIMPI|nr:ABC transporter permease [Limnochorda pilosa]BAS28187.1 glutathione ABC transporter permease GsiD [Limnochorda pilosa]
MNRLRAGTVLLGAMVLVAVVAPALAPVGPLEPDYRVLFSGPSPGHPLGTDELGRDVFSRVLHGGRWSLSVALAATVLAAAAGTVLGMAAVALGSWVDGVLSRCVDALLAFPGVLLALVAVTALGPGLGQTIAVLGLLGTPTFFRLSRGRMREVWTAAFVVAARAAGASEARILGRHVLPSVAGFLAIQAASTASTFLLVEATLSYLGLGVPPPTPTWGNVLQEARSYLIRQPWAVVGPGVALALTALALQLLSDGLRDRLDPMARGQNVTAAARRAPRRTAG